MKPKTDYELFRIAHITAQVCYSLRGDLHITDGLILMDGVFAAQRMIDKLQMENDKYKREIEKFIQCMNL